MVRNILASVNQQQNFSTNISYVACYSFAVFHKVPEFYNFSDSNIFSAAILIRIVQHFIIKILPNFINSYQKLKLIKNTAVKLKE